MNDKTVSTRRAFFSSAGAALSAPLAMTAASVASAAARPGDASADQRLAELEDVNAIRELNETYARHINAGAHDEAAALFVDARRAPVDDAVRTLSADRFGERDVVGLAADGTAATARIHCAVELETPIEPGGTLVEMARLQGDGVVRRTERRVLEAAYRKVGGVWKIERLAWTSA